MQAVGDQSYKTAIIAVSSQFLEMAGGRSHQFNIEEVLGNITAQMLSLGITSMYSPNTIVGQMTRSALQNVAGTIANDAITHTPLSIEDLAAQAIGGATSMGIAAEVESQFITPAQELERQKTAQMQNANAAARNLLEQQFIAAAQATAQMPVPDASINTSDEELAQAMGFDLSQMQAQSSDAGVKSTAQQTNKFASALNAMNAGTSAVDLMSPASVSALQAVNAGVGADRATRWSVPATTSSSNSSFWNRAVSVLADSKVVAEIDGIGSGVTDSFINAGRALIHPLDNIIKPTGQFIMDASVLAFDNDAINTQQAAARMDVRWNSLQRTFAASYSDLTSSNSFVQGHAIGGIVAAAGTITYGGDVAMMIGEGTENAAARIMFETTRSPDAVGAMARQTTMLQQNIGYNVSPTSWFSQYSYIGEQGTFLTDYQTINGILGFVDPNQEFRVGLFTYANQVSFFKARMLELNLGLDKAGQLSNGFRFSSVSGIDQMSPRSPLVVENNQNFVRGQGLPNGGPELVVDSLSTSNWPWKLSF